MEDSLEKIQVETKVAKAHLKKLDAQKQKAIEKKMQKRFKFYENGFVALLFLAFASIFIAVCVVTSSETRTQSLEELPFLIKSFSTSALLSIAAWIFNYKAKILKSKLPYEN